MRDERKSKAQLIKELQELRRLGAKSDWANRTDEAGPAEQDPHESCSRESDLLTKITTASPAYIVAIDREGKTRFMNQSMLDAIGYRSEEIEGEDYLTTFVPERERETLSSLFERLVRAPGQTINENSIVAKDGRELIVEWHGCSTTGQEGQVDDFIGVGIDVTNRTLAEEALRKSEERHRLLVENVPSVVWATDEFGKTIYISPNIERIYGFTQQEIYDSGAELWLDRIHPDDLDRVRQAFSALVEVGDSFDVEYRIEHKDGEWIWLHDQATTVKQEGGGRVAYGVFSDITKRKNAERKQQDSEAFVQNALDAQVDTFFVFDPRTGKAVRWNRAFEKSSGYSSAEIAELKAPDGFYSKEDLSKAAVATKTINEQGAATVEMELITKDGKRIPTEYRASPLLNPQGNSTHIISIGRDITERKLAEEALRENELKYRTLFEAAAEAIFTLKVTDEGAFVADCNPQTLRMFECSEEEIIGRAPADFSPPTQPDGRSSVERVREAVTLVLEGKPQVFEWGHCKADGTPFDAEVTLNRIEIAGERHLQAIVRDITDRKRAEREVEERLRFENLVREMSGSLLSAPASGTDKEIKRWLDRVLAYAGADRAGLRYSYDPDSSHLQLVFEATTAGTSPTINRDSDEYPWIVSRIQTGEPVCFSSLKELPAEARDRQTGMDEAVEASMIVPMIVSERFVGAFSFDSVNERDWSPELVGRMQLVANVLGNALERKRASEELHVALAEVRELKERAEAENVYLRNEVRLTHIHGDIIGQSSGMKSVLAQAEQVAQTDSSVLILGETGTGKELLARAIHNMSPRKDGSLVVVNCAAMPTTLVEGELFGREKGAFTGALTRQLGRFEVANGSTILLDEVGELSLEVQAKLLRVLQEGELQRLGSSNTIKVDVRVLAATNRDLSKEVAEGRFRPDLYYRLNVFPIEVPPLRVRPEDIPPLVWAFVGELNERMGKRVESIPQKTMDAMTRYAWPGNVRELRNSVERAMILCTGTKLHIQTPKASVSSAGHEDLTLTELERQHILEVMGKTGWRVRGKMGAAERLGVKPTTLDARMRKLGISRPFVETP